VEALLVSTSIVALAEIGDKTQLLAFVLAGTTLGMMIANVPAVLLGDQLAERLPVRLVHLIAAAIFAVLGIATLLGAEELFAL
jgi:putative Ca2+/H+ antiporter (TMEM165/GDT1 family)